MANHNIKITTPGIKAALNICDFSQSIAEYIWNGFDANATKVELDFESNEIGTLEKICVRDNGYGIPQNLLKQKFEPFLESEKLSDIGSQKNHSKTHGKNGVGRLTFFTFARKAVWNTVYKNDKNELLNYNIEIDSDTLEKFSGLDSKLNKLDSGDSGTEVIFTGIHTINAGNLEGEVLEFLKCEFGWFLELNKHRGLSLSIKGNKLKYEDLVGDREDKEIICGSKKDKKTFTLTYIQWKKKLNREYSRYYYIDSFNDEKWKEHTTLNNKGDQFHHSVFVKSNYFDTFNFEAAGENQPALVGKNKSDDVYKSLQVNLTNYLRRKRKPFLRESADKLVDDYQKEGVFPNFKKESWDELKKKELEDVVKGLYHIQPKIFNALNPEQKKTFIGLLNLVLDSEEREKIFDIIKEVVDLDSGERNELSELLKTTKLSRIISTINLIKARDNTISLLKELVFNPSLGANEKDDLQKTIEDHYWIFGEQYHLVVAAEEKFETALLKYKEQLGIPGGKRKIEHKDKNREMDIFICRQNKNIDTIDNIIVELKHPGVLLGEKELSQVKKYMSVILNQAEFNAPNMSWQFFLVGNKFDTSKFLEGEIQTNKPHGERSLVHKNDGDRYRIYVKTWSEIFTEVECRHNFLTEKLKFQHKKITGNDLVDVKNILEKEAARM